MRVGFLIAIFLFLNGILYSQTSTSGVEELKLAQLKEKKSEYNKLNNGGVDGYRIKIHFGIDREQAKNTRGKFSSKFPEIATYEEYQQPNFVILAGDYKTKLDAFKVLKQIQIEFPSSFIVKDKVKL
ncbi:MAG: SPOR domain-containing protein [Sphingobacteriaceae bacterium]|nr:SPOR domain-containing protein [Sphingobacteriaceae bacterium]